MAKETLENNNYFNDNELLSIYRRFKAIPALNQKLYTEHNAAIKILNQQKQHVMKFVDENPEKEALEDLFDTHDTLFPLKSPSHQEAFLSYLPLRNYFLNNNYPIEELRHIEAVLMGEFFDESLCEEFINWLEENPINKDATIPPPTMQRWQRHTLAYERASNALPLLAACSFLAMFASLLVAIKLFILGLILLGTPAGVPLLITAAAFVGLMLLCIGVIVSLAIASNLLDKWHTHFEHKHADKLDIDHPGLFSMTPEEIQSLVNKNIDPLKVRIELIKYRAALERIGWPHAWSTRLFNSADYKEGQQILQRVAILKAGNIDPKDTYFQIKDTEQSEHNDLSLTG